ncbi:hypothetical protein HDU80_001448, partial [Chytriomyces hyalinus]
QQRDIEALLTRWSHAGESMCCFSPTLPTTNTSSLSIPSQTGSIVPSTKPSLPANGVSTSTDSSSSNGGLIGGVVGGVLALLLLAGLAYWWFKRSKDSEKKAQISSSANPSSYNTNALNSSSSTYARDIGSEQIEIFSARGSASNPDTTTSSGGISSNINSTEFLTSKAARLEEQASSKEKKVNMALLGLLDMYSSSGSGASLASANSSMDLRQLKKEQPETIHASQWTTEDVCVWAARVLPGIGKTVAVKVMEHGVDGAMLFKLTNEHLRDDLGLVRLQDRMAFMDALARLKGDVDESVPVGPTGPPVYT